ncbi:Hypothetical_protein [Hexamita inflata]|uniref:Hypothetical_protein n=1 Tax=Hexamita inflata TaxID=28002 RepID=A0AA86RCV1_9EUKA|nr:Hypothetical protein HINF_LOCUS61617 [Hexamita inflata]
MQDRLKCNRGLFGRINIVFKAQPVFERSGGTMDQVGTKQCPSLISLSTKTFIIEMLWCTIMFKWSFFSARITYTNEYFIYCSEVLQIYGWAQATQNGGKECCFQSTNQLNAACTGFNFKCTCSPEPANQLNTEEKRKHTSLLVYHI